MYDQFFYRISIICIHPSIISLTLYLSSIIHSSAGHQSSSPLLFISLSILLSSIIIRLSFNRLSINIHPSIINQFIHSSVQSSLHTSISYPPLYHSSFIHHVIIYHFIIHLYALFYCLSLHPSFYDCHPSVVPSSTPLSSMYYLFLIHLFIYHPSILSSLHPRIRPSEPCLIIYFLQ